MNQKLGVHIIQIKIFNSDSHYRGEFSCYNVEMFGKV